MGLLDDAIREHLDLKRRRGADPAEVERAEHEALGPVRRHPEPAEELGYDQEAPLDEEGLPYDEELESEWEEEPLHESPELGSPAPAGEYGHPAADIAEPHWEHEGSFRDEAPADDAHAHGAAPAEPLPPTPRPYPAEGLSEETEEYEVASEHEPRRHGTDEDVLEETPEFLQDAPDHDRLWFEQRPPRDFNFDS